MVNEKNKLFLEYVEKHSPHLAIYEMIFYLCVSYISVFLFFYIFITFSDDIADILSLIPVYFLIVPIALVLIAFLYVIVILNLWAKIMEKNYIFDHKGTLIGEISKLTFLFQSKWILKDNNNSFIGKIVQNLFSKPFLINNSTYFLSNARFGHFLKDLKNNRIALFEKKRIGEKEYSIIKYDKINDLNLFFIAIWIYQ